MRSMQLYQTFSGVPPRTHQRTHARTHAHTHTHPPSPSPSRGMSETYKSEIKVESYKYAMFVSETRRILYI